MIKLNLKWNYQIYVCVVRRWFFGQIKRVDAEKLLMMSINDVGGYLVRESESVPGQCLDAG